MTTAKEHHMHTTSAQTIDWREARWHGSVSSSEIPDELRELSESA